MFHRSFGVPLALFWYCVAVSAALGWGDNGHIAVAKVADLYLTKSARDAISQLIPNNHIYDRSIAVYADWFKHTPAGGHTRSWHYVDTPIDATGYSPDRDCRQDNCVIKQIDAQRAILRDRSRPLADRRLALKLVVHFVGDIHQPLHCAERNHDAGGNEVAVRLRDQHGIRNLHSVWDADILDENMESVDPEEYAAHSAEGITPAERASWESSMDPAVWAAEGYKLAQTMIYVGVPVGSATPYSLSAKYIETAKGIVHVQIRKGGVRLAAVLNADLR